MSQERNGFYFFVIQNVVKIIEFHYLFEDIKPFPDNDIFLYLLKFTVFIGYKNGILAGDQ